MLKIYENDGQLYMGAMGPMCAHWAHGLLGWGDHSPRAPGAVGNCTQKSLFKELRVLCREFRKSLTSEKRFCFQNV